MERIIPNVFVKTYIEKNSQFLLLLLVFWGMEWVPTP